MGWAATNSWVNIIATTCSSTIPCQFLSVTKNFQRKLTTFRAALEKLAIRGIRSFDDKRVEVVQFFTPVTVIVGQNGSGKTVSDIIRQVLG